eukprot:comp15765_c1_seq1/m.12981 comp15765_c1_seq1/g.12981  ORF comp15765_c1_seq1/g.12981 comp15765_c1_seq1/m.12981 type:complete len:159 (-) comp15765_c1_seq1:145-621(-)
MNLGGGGGTQRPRSSPGMQGGPGNYVMPMSNRVTSPDIRNINPLMQQQIGNKGVFVGGNQQRGPAAGMQNIQNQRIGLGGPGGGGQGGFDMMEQSLQQLNLGAAAIPPRQDNNNPILFDNVSADLNINAMELEALLSSGGLDFGNLSNDISMLTGRRQ